MSILYGIINLKQQPVEPEHLAKMKNALLFSAPDKIFEWNHQNYAGGVMLQHYTPELLPEIFPLKDSTDKIYFSCAGRIDNRPELIHKLNLSISPDRITDSQLMHQAWIKWEKECMHHLSGDWSFVVYNTKTIECVIAKDHSGNTSIFYYRNSDFLVYCSSLKGILALPFVDQKLNDLKLAALLTSWRCSGSLTCYENIQSLPGAHILVCKEQIKVKQYWKPDHSQSLVLKNEEDYFEAFREIFSEAVKCRLSNIGSTAISLSGGFDSGSVASVAASQLAETHQRFSAYVSAPFYDASSLIPGIKMPDESNLVQLYPQRYKNIDLQVLRAQDISIIDSLETILDVYSEPISSPTNFYWMNDLYEKAQKDNHKTLLNGQGGNFTISWPITSFWDQMKDLKNPEWKISNFTSFKNLKRRILKPLAPEAIINWYSRMYYGNSPWMEGSMIGDSFARRTRLKSHILESGWYPPRYKKGNMQEIQSTLLNPKFNQAGRYHANALFHYGVESLDPTMDKRVIQFCLSLPDSVYINNEESRRLVRHGLKQFVPEEVIANRRRGQQAADVILRMHHQKERWLAFKKILNQSDFAKDYLNVKEMNEFINAMAHLKVALYSDAYKFMRATSIFIFLHKQIHGQSLKDRF